MLEAGVYICLEGGLGNQLFMYAAGKALAYRSNTPLMMNTDSGFRDDVRYQRKYMLSMFDVDYQHTSIDNFKTTKLENLINKLGPLEYRNVLLEKKTRSLQSIKVSKAIQLKGYWQSDDHFKDQWSKLSNDFNYKKCLSIESINILEKIQSSKSSVAVHFRTLDYRHALPETYYAEAIKLLSSMAEGTHYLIFADNFEGINLSLFSDLNYTVVNTKDDQEDFILMSKCHHQILANSTYSWWAAYLNKTPIRLL